MLKKLAFFLLLLSFVACKNPTDSGLKVQLDPEPEATIDSVLEQETNKTIITYAGGRDDSETILKLIENYNKQSEEYFVKYQELPYDYVGRYNYIYTTMDTKDVPFDVIEVNYSWIPEFASLGYIEALDSFVEKSGLDKNDYLESAFDASIYDGSLWALPYNISAGFLYVRSDIVGDIPKTWDELIEISTSLKDTSGLKYSYIMSGARSQMIFIEALEFIYSYGGSFFDQNGQLSLNKEGISKGLNKLAEIYFSDYVPLDISAITNQEARNRFINGESVFLRSDINTWVYSNNPKSNILGKFSIAPLPSGEEGVSTVLDGYANAINAKSNNKEAAFDFLEYLSGAEAQRKLVLDAGKMPVLLEIFNDREVVSVNPYFATDKFINTINSAVSRPKTTQYKRFTDIFLDELNQFLYQQKTAEQVVDSMESRFKAYL